MANNSHTHPVFAGRFDHAMDAKNRITIPSRWRREQAEEFIIIPERNDFLRVMSQAEFARVTAGVESDANIPPHDRRVFLRQLHATAQLVTIDRQGRLVLPEEFCRLLGLDGEVTLIGGGARFEIWNPARWRQVETEQKATYQRVVDQIGF